MRSAESRFESCFFISFHGLLYNCGNSMSRNANGNPTGWVIKSMSGIQLMYFGMVSGQLGVRCISNTSIYLWHTVWLSLFFIV
jgi:hypothetical protein